MDASLMFCPNIFYELQPMGGVEARDIGKDVMVFLKEYGFGACRIIASAIMEYRTNLV